MKSSCGPGIGIQSLYSGGQRAYDTPNAGAFKRPCRILNPWATEVDYLFPPDQPPPEMVVRPDWTERTKDSWRSPQTAPWTSNKSTEITKIISRTYEDMEKNLKLLQRRVEDLEKRVSPGDGKVFLDAWTQMSPPIVRTTPFIYIQGPQQPCTPNTNKKISRGQARSKTKPTLNKRAGKASTKRLHVASRSSDLSPRMRHASTPTVKSQPLQHILPKPTQINTCEGGESVPNHVTQFQMGYSMVSATGPVFQEEQLPALPRLTSSDLREILPEYGVR